MKIKALIWKFIMVTVVLWVVLGLFGVSFGDILLTSIVLTGVSYIGDRIVLPRVGNVSATLADLVLSFVVIWLLGSFLYEEPIQLVAASLTSAIIITAGEFLFHLYLQKQAPPDEKPQQEEKINVYQKNNMQTEFGSEVEIKPPIGKKTKAINHKQRPKKRKKKNPY